MPRFRTGRVDSIQGSRPGIQHVTVDSEPAYVLTQIIGPVQVGEAVIVNTTAVDLGLGTGGRHVVHWNLSRSHVELDGDGHIMKARYLSEQVDVGTWEEKLQEKATLLGSELPDLGGLIVAGCLLHSQVAALAIAISATSPSAKIGYVMTDWASLPIALSDVVDELLSREMLDLTITTGHAFGGQLEAISVASGLLAAHHHDIDIVIVGPGPGHAGTGSRLGFSAIDVVGVLDMASALGAEVTYLPRWSSTDSRQRHQGLSHHSRTVLSLIARPVVVATPPGPVGDELVRFVEASGAHVRIEHVDPVDVRAAFGDCGLSVMSMGRNLGDDTDALALVGAVAKWCIETSSPVSHQ